MFYRVYLRLMDLPVEKQKELIEFLKKEKKVWWIATLDGNWDFVFAIWVKTNNKFREFYNRLSLGFRQHIKDRLICPITAYKQFAREYFLGKKKTKKETIVGESKEEKYDKTDLEILKMLSKNARITLLEIANRLHLDSMTIYHRIKKLETKKIIQGYRADLDISLLKRDFYSVKVNVRDISQIKQMESYIKTIPETTAVIEAVGSYDFEFDLEVDSSERYFKIIEDLKKKFNMIREVSYFRVLKNYKVLYMVEV